MSIGHFLGRNEVSRKINRLKQNKTKKQSPDDLVQHSVGKSTHIQPSKGKQMVRSVNRFFFFLQELGTRLPSCYPLLNHLTVRYVCNHRTFFFSRECEQRYYEPFSALVHQAFTHAPPCLFSCSCLIAKPWSRAILP